MRICYGSSVKVVKLSVSNHICEGDVQANRYISWPDVLLPDVLWIECFVPGQFLAGPFMTGYFVGVIMKFLPHMPFEIIRSQHICHMHLVPGIYKCM